MAERVLEESQMIADQNDIRVLIADDHEIIRKGLRIFLEYEGFQCVGEAENGVRAVDLCKEFHPDVVLMDLVMPQMDGIEATRLIRKNNPQTQVIALTNYDLDDNVLQVLQAGATSFLVKNVTIEDIADAIRAASVGQSTLSTEAITNLVSNNKQPQFQLTPRELEILNLMTQGLNNREISKRLFITVSTVKNHITSIFAKIGVTRRSKAVALAVHYNLVDLPD